MSRALPLSRLSPPRRPLLSLAALGAAAVTAIPLCYLLVRALTPGWAGWAETVLTTRVAELTARSLALAAVVTAACVVLGVGSGFAVTRTDLPARRAFAVLAALPLAVPTYIAAFTWVSTFRGMEGFWPAALVLTLCCYPYVFLPVTAALVGADPAQEEVSASLGRGPLRTGVAVTLGQIRPAIGAGALLVALYVLSDFGAVSILRTDTFTRAVFVTFDLGFDRTGAVLLSTALVLLTVVVLSAESVTRTRHARYTRLGSGARRPHPRLRLGRARLPVAAAMAGLCALSLGLPAVNLARRLAAGVSEPGTLGEVARATGATLWLAGTGAALTTVLALPVGLLAVRSPGRLAALLERLTYLSHALPGVVIGLSLVFFGINVAYPLYQSTWLLALGYAALFMPLAVAGIAAAAAQAPAVLEEVASSLGRRPLGVLRTVTLPLMIPGVASGAALVFIACVKELPATLLLRPTGMDTLATELWTQASVAAYAAATPYAALLLVVSAGPAWLLARRTGVLAESGAQVSR
nr:iron ABC transporter permease [Parafrankia soli]